MFDSNQFLTDFVDESKWKNVSKCLLMICDIAFTNLVL